MDKETVRGYIIALIGSFTYDPHLLDELVEILAKSGREMAFYRLMTVRIMQLLSERIHAVRLEEFENLGGGLYSMHFASKGFNVRILYSFLPNGEPVFLRAFNERAGKRKTDYSSQIPIAASRLKAMKGKKEHE